MMSKTWLLHQDENGNYIVSSCEVGESLDQFLVKVRVKDCEWIVPKFLVYDDESNALITAHFENKEA